MHSSAHETLSRTDHTLGHKADFSKFKKSEIKSSSAMRLEINYKEKSTAKKKKKCMNTWRLNNVLLKQPMDHLRNQRLNEKKKTPRNK